MFWPTPSSARVSSRSSAPTPAPRKSARSSPQNTAAGLPQVTRRCWPIQRSRRSSTRRRTMRIWQQPPLPKTKIKAIITTTPTDAHLAPPPAAAAAGKHVFLDKPIANSISDGRAITEVCRKAGVVLALGYQRRRESHFRWIRQQVDDGVFGKLVNAEANISRDRLSKIDLAPWLYQAAAVPGGVMLQLGIHYIAVLEYLIGPIKAVRGQLAQLVLPGDNPDVASLMLEHDNGALSTLNASYASASEYYLMNIYGRGPTGYYHLNNGLRLLKRG